MKVSSAGKRSTAHEMLIVSNLRHASQYVQWKAILTTLLMFLSLQSADAPIVGIASMPLPHAQRVAIAALDSNGFLHLFSTPLPAAVVVWDKQADAPAAEVPGAAQQGVPGPALGASRGSGGSQEQERAADNAGSGDILQKIHNCSKHRRYLFALVHCPLTFKQDIMQVALE